MRGWGRDGAIHPVAALNSAGLLPYFTALNCKIRGELTPRIPPDLKHIKAMLRTMLGFLDDVEWGIRACHGIFPVSNLFIRHR